MHLELIWRQWTCVNVLRDAVCIFYLVLRALDTLEDDMTVRQDIKIPMLKDFYTYLLEPDWKFVGSNEKDCIVLEDFPTVGISLVFQFFLHPIDEECSVLFLWRCATPTTFEYFHIYSHHSCELFFVFTICL